MSKQNDRDTAKRAAHDALFAYWEGRGGDIIGALVACDALRLIREIEADR